MFFSKCIHGILTHIQDLTGAEILTPYFYDLNPGDFGVRVHDRIARSSFEDKGNDWLFTVYSRGAQEPVSDLPRQHTVVDRNKAVYSGDKYRLKFVKCPIQIAFLSNSIDLLEDFEEALLVMMDRLISLKISDYPVSGGDMSIELKNIQPVGITKLDPDKDGTLCALKWNLEAHYPVFYTLEKNIKLIKYERLILHTHLNIEIL